MRLNRHLGLWSQRNKKVVSISSLFFAYCQSKLYTETAEQITAEPFPPTHPQAGVRTVGCSSLLMLVCMRFLEVYPEINTHKYMDCTQTGKAAFWKKARNIKILKCSSKSNEWGGKR